MDIKTILGLIFVAALAAALWYFNLGGEGTDNPAITLLAAISDILSLVSFVAEAI